MIDIQNHNFEDREDAIAFNSKGYRKRLAWLQEKYAHKSKEIIDFTVCTILISNNGPHMHVKLWEKSDDSDDFKL